MNLLFYDTAPIQRGSTRIFIYNLYRWMQSLGYDVTLNSEDFSAYKAVIFGKSVPLSTIKLARRKNPEACFGLVGPSDLYYSTRQKIALVDFLVTGSVEEQDYYLQYSDHPFVFPHIETIFTKHKHHVDSRKVIIGYHGNKDHLEQLGGARDALERLSQKRPVHLIAIYNIAGEGLWKRNRPNIPIEDVQWDIDTVERELLRADIGILPGLTPISSWQKALLYYLLRATSGSTRYKNDYFLEFKNTTNAGRAFVFYQLGIPVIADFLPSAFRILGDESNGFLAHSAAGWSRALTLLSDSASLRTQIAQNAYNAFTDMYDPITHAKDFHKNIVDLYNRKTKK